ncbi:trypsin beta-like [Drosophila pseudoobscura]|uniref:Trypsin beta-like n=1 Tax=Drosophila pseudoobscura pseudoobscura TaxID=46245 RepID=A0A6I8UCE3_DROPS|nr:trypsin beta [Drosophila pseudoobscura]
MDCRPTGSVIGIAVFAWLWLLAAGRGQPQSLTLGGYQQYQQTATLGGYFLDNGTHYLLYERPRVTRPSFLPLSYFGNISSNPGVNALETLDYLPTRIVNGKRIKCSRAPYQCAISYQKYFICGCVILNRSWILTAHHCIVGAAGNYQVRAGTTQQRRGGQLRNVKKIVAHAGYSDYTMRNDLAMMKLSKPLKYNRCLKPVRLPSRKIRRFPRCYLVSGWGLTSANAQNVQRYLRGVRVCKVRRGKCQKKYKGTGVKIYKDMICAASPGKDSCSGDSGGPLVHGNILYGVVSFGIGCANRKYPGVYVNVKRYVPWIKKVMRKY